MNIVGYITGKFVFSKEPTLLFISRTTILPVTLKHLEKQRAAGRNGTFVGDGSIGNGSGRRRNSREFIVLRYVFSNKFFTVLQ